MQTHFIPIHPGVIIVYSGHKKDSNLKENLNVVTIVFAEKTNLELSSFLVAFIIMSDTGSDATAPHSFFSQEKVQRCDIWRPVRPSCQTSTSNPAVWDVLSRDALKFMPRCGGTPSFFNHDLIEFRDGFWSLGFHNPYIGKILSIPACVGLWVFFSIMASSVFCASVSVVGAMFLGAFGDKTRSNCHFTPATLLPSGTLNY